jgi:hypothetical protein
MEFKMLISDLIYDMIVDNQGEVNVITRVTWTT